MKAVSLPSTSLAHDSVVAAFATADVDFYTTFLLHMVKKFVSFLSIGGCSSASLVVEVLLLSTTTSSMLPDRCCGRPHLPLQLRSSSSANRAIAFLNLCPTALPPLLCRRLSGPLLHPLSRAPLLPPCWTRSNIRSTPISPASFDPLSCSSCSHSSSSFNGRFTPPRPRITAVMLLLPPNPATASAVAVQLRPPLPP
ncbi:hypothetical protein BHE74_00015084 [Ensete ventricosum]|nr:hypothetical protein BHE74_00015084 [Ensete ventricosum]